MVATKKRSDEIAKEIPSPMLENVTNDDVRHIANDQMDIGDVYAQGDLMFVRIAALPSDAKPRSNRQLAEGTTQGSRHICTRGEVFSCPPQTLSRRILEATGLTVEPQYLGPVVVTDDDGRLDIEHPEHGNHEYRSMAEPMVLACVFQRSLDFEERAARVQD